jgi:DNA-directed RNA polymerase specialized sigma24 family protein
MFLSSCLPCRVFGKHHADSIQFFGGAVAESDPHISGLRKPWELDRDAWEALLAALAPDRELAGHKYEGLRRRLINLFAWEQRDAPDQLADEVLNRLSRKVMEGTEIPHLDRFAFGIARLVIQEEIRRQRNRETAVQELKVARPDPPDWTTLDSMQQCLDALPSDRRELIERYYAEDRGVLAGKLGLSLNALRNRAMRIRGELFRCMSERDGS